jgi:heme-degrading monooxygenase HmoA
LLEPINKNEDFISLTAWETEADANAYHTSGVYKQLVDKVRATYSKDPILKVYSSESVMEPV